MPRHRDRLSFSLSTKASTVFGARHTLTAGKEVQPYIHSHGTYIPTGAQARPGGTSHLGGYTEVTDTFHPA